MEQTQVKTTYTYVIDLTNRLQSSCELAKQELLKGQFKAGDKCLILLSISHRLLAQWKSPCKF